MKFDDLESRMKSFEFADDPSALPGVFLVARIDGRGFSRLTKETHDFEAPFDIRFRDMMVGAVEHLMTCGFRAIYGYTQSDEISILFHRDDGAFDRKFRKLNSILASEATASFVLKLGAPASFDCRVCQLPQENDVLDYFRWRQEDATRNALNGHCYWLLRKSGKNVRDATKALERLNVAQKNELLFKQGVNFNNVPKWQKRGVGVYWETYSKDGLNPKTGAKTKAIRRRLKADFDLPMKKDYDQFITEFISLAKASGEG